MQELIINIAQTSAVFALFMILIIKWNDKWDPPFWFKVIVVLTGCSSLLTLFATSLILIWI